MDDLARLTELRRSDPDIEMVCNLMVAKLECTSAQQLAERHPDVFAELMLIAENMAGLDPEPGAIDEWPVRP